MHEVKKCDFNRIVISIYFRKLVPSTDCLSTNSRTEEMTVTPDMPLPNIDVGLISSHIGPAYYNNKIYPVDQVPDRPAQVTPETGFHFLFSTEQTVDLTDSDNLQQK